MACNVSRILYFLFHNGPLTIYVKWRVPHVPGMSGTISRHRLQRKPLVNDPGMHHGTCVTHVSWCMSGSLTRGGGENGRLFADDMFQCRFVLENFHISIQNHRILTQSVQLTDNKTTLVQVKARCRTGDKPLLEAVMTRITYAYMRQYVNSLRPSDAYMRR